MSIALQQVVNHSQAQRTKNIVNLVLYHVNMYSYFAVKSTLFTHTSVYAFVFLVNVEKYLENLSPSSSVDHLVVKDLSNIT